MDKIDLLILVSMIVGYLLFTLIDELADRFIYKVKTVRLKIDAKEYKELKTVFKNKGRKIEKELQPEIVDYLQVVYLGKESDV